jgi:uncharacterized protein YegP (UPF0339 family)
MAKVITATIYEDKAGRFRWRAVSANGKQLAKSPKGYKTEDALMDDFGFMASKDHDPIMYKDRKGEWRWRLMKDGKIVAITSEGYNNKKDCEYSANLVLDAKVV